MLTRDLNTIEINDFGGGLGTTFPFSSADGVAATATVYITLEPGGVLPEHTDSAEEVLLVLEGTVEASVGDETGELSAGQLALVPALAPHSLRNLGDGPVRVFGFFNSATNVAVFTEPLGPGGPQVMVVGAVSGLPVPVAQTEAVAA